MEISINVDFLAGIVGKPAGEISEALKLDDDGKPTASKDEVEGLLKTAFEDKVKTIQKNSRDEGYGRGKKEALDSVEKELADEYNINKLPIKDMFEAYSKKLQESSKDKKISPDDIKNSEPYKELKKNLEEKYQALENEHNTFRSEVETQRLQRAIQSKGHEILASQNFELPESEELAKNTMSLIVKEALATDKYKFLVDDNGIAVTDQEGRAALDSAGNAITFDNYFTGLASQYLPKRDGKKRDTPGGKTTPPGTGGGSMRLPDFSNYNEGVNWVNDPTRELKPDQKREALSQLREKFNK